MYRVIAIIFFLLPFFLLSCSSEKDTKNIAAIKFNIPPVIFTAQIDSSRVRDTLQYIFVKASLNNPSVSTFKYITMTCAWAQSFTTNSKLVQVLYTPCFLNWYYTHYLDASKTEEYYLTLITSKSLKKLRFNIGLNLIQPHDTPIILDSIFYYITDMKHVIWSNPLDLNPL